MSDTLTLTVHLPVAVIQDAIASAAAREFRKPAYGESTGIGWGVVETQVRQFITTVDLSDLIRRYTEARLSQAVDEAVTRLLQEKARAKAREMARNGTLLPVSPVPPEVTT